MNSLKHRSELELKRLIRISRKNIRKRQFKSDQHLTSDIALYLQSKSLITIAPYANGSFAVHLQDKAFSYFEDKHDRTMGTILKSFVIPIIVSVIGTLITLVLSN